MLIWKPNLNDGNIDIIVLSNKVLFGKKNYKYFIGCENDDEEATPFSVMFPKTTAYRRDFDESK